MDWDKMESSNNVEDRRRGGMRRPAAIGGGLGIGGVIIAVIVGLITGQNPLQLLGLTGNAQPQTYDTSSQIPQNDEDAKFVSKILGNTETFWGKTFQKLGRSYQQPKLALYQEATDTACGLGEAASGPFYCPGDQKVYLDLSFFQELSSTYGAPGRFAQAYVIAHEIGHHVQNQLGISSKVQQIRSQSNPSQANALSVRLELQADCFAGVWGHSVAQNPAYNLSRVDLESGLKAANAVGDDTLQRQAQGRVVPDSFTHGSSKQRIGWFSRGFEKGNIQQCDTFSAKSLNL
jgi:uncharacterized protein